MGRLANSICMGLGSLAPYADKRLVLRRTNEAAKRVT